MNISNSAFFIIYVNEGNTFEMQLSCGNYNQVYADGAIISEAVSSDTRHVNVPFNTLSLGVFCSGIIGNNFLVKFSTDSPVDPNQIWRCTSNAPLEWTYRNFDDGKWSIVSTSQKENSWSSVNVGIIPLQNHSLYCRRRLSK